MSKVTAIGVKSYFFFAYYFMKNHFCNSVLIILSKFFFN